MENVLANSNSLSCLDLALQQRGDDISFIVTMHIILKEKKKNTASVNASYLYVLLLMATGNSSQVCLRNRVESHFQAF